MKPYLNDLLARETSSEHRLHAVREYLQSRILEGLVNAGLLKADPAAAELRPDNWTDAVTRRVAAIRWDDIADEAQRFRVNPLQPFPEKKQVLALLLHSAAG